MYFFLKKQKKGQLSSQHGSESIESHRKWNASKYRFTVKCPSSAKLTFFLSFFEPLQVKNLRIVSLANVSSVNKFSQSPPPPKDEKGYRWAKVLSSSFWTF
jgi:hypothetical protein